MPKFIVFVRANAKSETGRMPTKEALTEMGAYNKQLVDAGILIAGEGLLASSHGARITWPSTDPVVDPPIVTKGPFPVNEVVAGFWIFEVPDLEAAINWLKKSPVQREDWALEVRKIAGPENFGEELTPELKEEEEKLRTKVDDKFTASGIRR